MHRIVLRERNEIDVFGVKQRAYIARRSAQRVVRGNSQHQRVPVAQACFTSHRYRRISNDKNSVTLQYSLKHYNYTHAKTLGKKIQAFRILKGLLQKDFAEIVGISGGILSRIENDDFSHCSKTTLQNIEKFICKL